MGALLKMEDICKSFSGIKVLHDVNLDLRAGEVHALLGENGAGKSTLIKILGGAYTKDSGTIKINDKEVNITNVDSANNHGIRMIYQELMLIPDMTVAENIYLGQELKTKAGLVDHEQMITNASQFIKEMNLEISPTTLVGKLNIAQQQMVEILRAISFGAKIIVMDEPTASLTDTEVDALFEGIGKLKKEKVGIIYISHRMSELDKIADRITILRDGEYIKTVYAKETNHDELVSLMVGREIKDLYSKHNHVREEVVLSIENLKSNVVKNVNFDLKKGEVLGLSGLVGAGRSEAMKCLLGIDRKISGKILVEGKEVEINCVQDAIRTGIGFVPEDRKREGLFAVQGIRFNATICVLKRFLQGGRYNSSKEMDLVNRFVDNTMNTKYTSVEQQIGKLSGGNQQKVIISRWLLATEKILILDEPTRGIDVKTKSDIYHLIDKLTEEGMSVIFISSEMPELINMCDRIVVMSHGYTTGELLREEFTQEKIMELSTVEKGERE